MLVCVCDPAGSLGLCVETSEIFTVEYLELGAVRRRPQQNLVNLPQSLVVEPQKLKESGSSQSCMSTRNSRPPTGEACQETIQYTTCACQRRPPTHSNSQTSEPHAFPCKYLADTLNMTSSFDILSVVRTPNARLNPRAQTFYTQKERVNPEFATYVNKQHFMALAAIRSC